MEEDFHPEEEFDFVVVVYGLHWMKNLKKVSEAIAKALRRGGMFISLVYLESRAFFAGREAMMKR